MDELKAFRQALTTRNVAERHLKQAREAPRRMDNALKTKINHELRSAGFDGNGRFRSIGHAINVATGIIEKNGVELAEVMSAHRFNKPEGHEAVELAFKTDDPFSPVEIDNTRLALSWTELQEGRLEAIAYLS